MPALIEGTIYDCAYGGGIRRLDKIEPYLLHYSLLIDSESNTWYKCSGTIRCRVEKEFVEGTIVRGPRKDGT